MSQIGTTDELQTINEEENTSHNFVCELNSLQVLVAFTNCHLLFGHLHIGFLTAFVVDTFVTSVNVHTSLSIRALVSSCLTFVYV